ncbi:calcium-binding protein, putative [Entamoeba invadens IP1]|uniref:Calcium-binding protein, putative n=1 Tax=Entamoeba invadens IP1 TaxID=370355 RepID=A0A0A1TVN3_ENTIV|nr:calcium-binding protein, putative [Entamoeba invadens IP1]ELP84507.1 calcium-binding protein, putative [Entamoeba invadens IP1]|eukprot:XP_004183853.1 calcium-binding protein, putative [Entamoeba invadens IP1]
MAEKPPGRTIEEFFADIDTNKTGKVNADEYFEGVKMWRRDIVESDKASQTLLFNLADLDDDGEIDIRQFARLMAILNKGFGKDAKSVFTTVFLLLDIHDKGKIGEKELARLMKKMGKDLKNEEIESFLDSVDGDLDGYITLQEFLKFFLPPQDKNTVPSNKKAE